jgi:hypothetical protein
MLNRKKLVFSLTGCVGKQCCCPIAAGDYNIYSKSQIGESGKGQVAAHLKNASLFKIA